MPPIKHALLGASSAARWIACPPSARLTENMEGGSSKYAEEGSRAHEVCEAHLRHCLKYWKAGRAAPVLGESIRLDGQPDDPAEMIRAANLYVDFLHGLWLGFASCPGVFIEQEVNVEQWVPGGFGTCDCLLIGDSVLHIVDFKYGQGVPVSCENNPQLMYYALGAYALFAATDEIQTVRMSIVQPRIQEEPETFEMPLADLLDWAEKTLRPAAMLAWEGKGNFAPGEKQCRFCRAYPTCRAWQDKYGELAGFEPLPQPATLSDKELGEWLRKLVGLADYARDLEEYAQQALLDGHQIPGWKLVEGRSTRKWSDQDAAFRQMQAAGIDEAMLYTHTPISLTVAEKLIGKKQFAETMSAFITKAPGAPKLANDSDPRPAYNNLDGFKAEED